MFKTTLTRKDAKVRLKDRELAAKLGGLLLKSIFVNAGGYFSETYEFKDEESFKKFTKAKTRPSFCKKHVAKF